MISADLFKNKVIRDAQVIDTDLAQCIYEGLITGGYVKKGVLTDKYYEDKQNGRLEIAEEAADCASEIIAIIDSIYDSRSMQPENARMNNVELAIDRNKLDSREFKALWAKINARSVYTVEFNEAELIDKAVAALNKDLRVAKMFFQVEYGAMSDIGSKEQLFAGGSMAGEKINSYQAEARAGQSVKYDLIGKIVAETGLTRAAAVKILRGIAKSVFGQLVNNPEEFILRAASIINEQKATVIIQHITYNKLDSVYDTAIFTEPGMKGQLGVNAMAANKHLYDYVLYDSANERNFAEKIDASNEVAVYVKLPRGFYISTPIGRYNPDWAIVFHQGKVKHIYFVAETKGSMSSLQLRLAEDAKIHCAREHFKAIAADSVVYDVVDSYTALMNKVMG
jgi:type III restriction enzyme